MDPRDLIQAGFHYALSLSHDRDQAKDLVQEAWARLSRKSYEINKNLLFRAIRNLQIDKTRRPHLVLVDSTQVDESAAPAATPRGDIEAALTKLNADERETIYLSVMEGYSAEEIAYLVDRPRNTVLSQLRRGKEKLRAALSRGERDVMP